MLLVVALGGLIVAPRPAAAREIPAVEEPWASALRYDFDPAAREFAARHAADPADTRIALGHASTLLLRQPRTAANVAAAQAVLRRVGQDAADPEHRWLARYLLARIEHDHGAPPRRDVARAAYEALIVDAAGHPVADHAALQLALLLVYHTPTLPLDDALAEVTTLISRVRTADARRELHTLLGQLHWERRHDPRQALPHFLAARHIGFDAPGRNANYDLTIAGLAAETGEHALAARHYRTFVRDNPLDLRAGTATRLAAEAEHRARAAAAAPPAPAPATAAATTAAPGPPAS
jgi:hypothetical protein